MYDPMRNTLSVVCCVICFFVFLPVPIMAASLTFTLPVTSFGEQEAVLTASVSGLVDGDELYIKGAFFRMGSSNYFGYTKSADTWIKNSVATVNQRKVKIGEWNNQLIIKPDYSDTGFTGNGEYYVKVGFYTVNGSDVSSVNWSTNTATVTLTAPTPTATPQPSNTPTPSPTKSPDPSSTPTKTPTKIPTIKPTAKVNTPTPTKTDTEEEDDDVVDDPQQGIVVTPTNTPTPSPEVLGTAVDAKTILPLAFVGIGSGILSLLGAVTVWEKRRKANDYIIKDT